MKKLIQNKYSLLFLACCMLFQVNKLAAQEVVKLHYFNANNKMQYLLLESNLKKGKVLTPLKNKKYELYLDSAATNLFAKVQTDDEGKAKAFLPISLKSAWEASPQHTFRVKAGEEEIISDYAITKAKITIDTTADKNITVAVMKMENNKWIPAKDVEMKIGVQRLDGSILSAGDEPTFTTDSSGTITTEFKKLKLLGDENGNFVLAAKVEDNDQLGNLLAEKQVSWGVASKVNKDFFNQRTLWTTRFRTPYWLLALAYSIIIGVWGTLFYLIIQLIKIKKLGA